ncbi:hypothetical protein pipiens_003067 [Culex pipiens pipiens]|uniref:trypsin n=1 Tax=Culex pipiens pipiens TaxID=38569 RepID=A0ABD1D750_CULPP
MITANAYDDNAPYDSGQGRIAGGINATITEHPYLVALESNSRLVCGGSIVSPNLILTAAHCLINRNPSHVAVRYGSTDREKGGTVVPTKQFFVHSDFDTQTTQHDIALIELEEPIIFSRSARPVQIIKQLIDLPPGTKCIVSGWGMLNTYGPMADRLQSVRVPLWNMGACGKAYPTVYLGEGKLCAGSAGKDSCQADSGGPLVCNGKLVGLVSFGQDCGDPRHPGVYTSVQHYLDWIEMAKSPERRQRERTRWIGSANHNYNSGKNDASKIDPKLVLSLVMLFAFKLQQRFV